MTLHIQHDRNLIRRLAAADKSIDVEVKPTAPIREDDNGNFWVEAWIFVSKDADRGPEEEVCAHCRGSGCVDENGNPNVWGRADSYECYVCEGTGRAPRPEVDEGG